MEATLQRIVLFKEGGASGKKRVVRLNSRMIWVLSSIHLSVGLFCVATQATAFGVYSNKYYDMYEGLSFLNVGHGFWCGGMFIATAIVGMIAAKTKHKCPTVGFLTLSLVSAVCCVIPLLVLSLVGFFKDSVPYHYYLSSTSLGGMLLVHAYFFSMAVMEALTTTYSAIIALDALLKNGATNVQTVGANLAGQDDRVFLFGQRQDTQGPQAPDPPVVFADSDRS